jgi:hypothetical protein
MFAVSHARIHSHESRLAKLLRLIPLRGTQSRSVRSGRIRRLAAFQIFRLNVHVSQPPKPRRPGPPRNPGVRDLVKSKWRWSSPPKQEDAERGFRGWHERGYLPHRDEPGLTQFVTFRLADSFSESLRSEWEHLWKIEDDQRRRTELEAYLDQGRGECHLRQPEIAQLVEEAVRFFHGERYDLRAWVVAESRSRAVQGRYHADGGNSGELEEAHGTKGEPAVGTAR